MTLIDGILMIVKDVSEFAPAPVADVARQLADHADLIDLAFTAIATGGLTKEAMVGIIKDAMKMAADAAAAGDLPP